MPDAEGTPEVYDGEEIRLSIMIGGEAGYGIVSAGEVLARAFARCTLHIAAYSEVPSLIRGGHNTFQICISTRKIHSLWEHVDFLIALDRMTIDLNTMHMNPGGTIVYDSDHLKIEQEELDRDDVDLLPMPLSSMAEEHGSGLIMRNTVALGAAIALASYDCETLEEVLADQYASKGDKIVAQNKLAARAGFDYVNDHHPHRQLKDLKGQMCGLPHIVLSGNNAIGMGALRGGLTFYAGYPMTPASPLLHWLIQLEEEMGIVAKQTEDEISAIMMTIGAASAGARAMTGTSGGGFCLMTEALGLAGMAEVPIVVMLGQRPGPATGLATRTDQADMFFAIHASQGEFPRAVLTPGDVHEAFTLGFEAFNLAERFQTPVIIMGDRILNEGLHCTGSLAEEREDMVIDRGKLLSEEEAQASLVDGHFQHYVVNDEGVSPRAIFGHKGVVVTFNGNEHNEYGDTWEGRTSRRSMVWKRQRKLEGLRAAVPKPYIVGPEDAEVTLVGWGSTKMPAEEALHMLEEMGHPSVNYLHFPSVWPIDREHLKTLLAKCERLVGVETNSTAQLCELIAREVLVEVPDRILKFNGRPMTPDFIIRGLQGVIGW